MRGAKGEFTPRREPNHRRPRGYASWRPQAKTRAIVEQVLDVLDPYAEHLPLTVRQVFYRLVGAYGFPKTEAAYHRLGDILVRARRARVIDFADLRDDGVTAFWERWYASPGDFWDDAARRAKRYQRDRQQGQAVRVELWCESAGMLPQLARVADGYSVPVYSAGGFVSLTAVRQIVDRAIGRNGPTVLLHVGDFDPSGEAIFGHIAEDVVAFVQEDRIIESQQVIPLRLALTLEQVELYGLATAPAKANGSDSAKWRCGTCQFEALAPDDLASIIRTGIEARLDLPRLRREINAEHADQREIRSLLPGGGGE